MSLNEFMIMCICKCVYVGMVEWMYVAVYMHVQINIIDCLYMHMYAMYILKTIPILLFTTRNLMCGLGLTNEECNKEIVFFQTPNNWGALYGRQSIMC